MKTALTACSPPLAPRASTTALRIPDCSGLANPRWQGGDMARLRESLPGMLDPDADL